MEEERISVPRGERELAALWRRSSLTFSGHIIITSHGLLSYKGASKYESLAKRACQLGLGVFSFDYSGCGESSGLLKESSVGERIEDLSSVIDYVKGWAETQSISLMGSSLGGYISLFQPSMGQGEIRSLVTWASPFDLSFFLEDEEYSFEELGLSFYQELAEGRHLQAPSGISNLFVIHGSEDRVIPVSHAYQLYERAREPKSLEIFSKGDHRFLNDEHRGKAIDLTLDWILLFI